MTKVLVFLVALFAVGSLAKEKRRDDRWPPPEILETLRPIQEVCRQKTGVTNEAIIEFDLGEIHDDPALKCYMQCLFVELDGVDENGEVHLERLQMHIDNLDGEIQMIMIRMAKKCLYPKGDTLCDRAFWYHQCWKTADEKHYFLV